MISVSNPAVGTATFSGSTLNVTVNPDQFANGTVSVEVSDGGVGTPVAFDVPVNVNAVNDDPVFVGPIPPIVTDEDVDASIDLLGVVSDADDATLAYSVTSVNNVAVNTASFGGSVLSVDVADDLFASGTISVEVTDGNGGPPVAFDVPVDINPVNDDPVFVGPIPPLNTDEDVDGSVDLLGVVTDIDDTTLGYVITSVDNAAINSAIMVGSVLNVDVLDNQFGTGTVSIEVTDGKGGPSIPFDVPVNIGSVNDVPFVLAPVSNVNVLEDADPLSVDFSGVFDDNDISTGDVLTISAVFGSGAAVFDSISTSGTDVDLVFAANQNGTADVIVTATDTEGASVDYSLVVDVAAVNDAPVASGSLSNVTMAEDDAPTPFPVDGAFTDVDILTNGDFLTFDVVSTSQPTYFDALTISGNSLIVDLSSNANGLADISIVAHDSNGIASSVVTFTLTISSVNDLPTANDDAVSMDEDGGTLTIPVLANDDIPDMPGSISAVTQPTTYSYLDINGDTLTVPIGGATIDGDNILFTPGSNFWGTAEFTYTLRDPQGDESTATVTVTVVETNDAPEARQYFGYSTFKNTDLVVNLVNGLRLGIYDIDNSKLDGNGDPIVTQNITAVFETDPPPTEGFLFAIDPDGSFTFRPAGDFVGVTGFDFTVIDDGSPTFLKSLIGTVEIEVIEPQPSPDDPTPGEVSVLFNLSNTPLEQSSTVSPNVLVTMDDSGSMDWHITIDSTDDNARFVINNSSIATSNVRERVFTYLWDLPVNSYSVWSGNGRIVPSQESLPPGNDYNVWQARSAAFNRIYYNPEVTYLPWSGVDNGGTDFANANPTAIRLDPMTGSSNLLNILNSVSYLSTSVPRWQTNGGTANINVTNYYIPRYYFSDGSLVEIRTG
ncbi:MAG: Ig-like domain-containing protein, partial [Rhodothermales bacterium]|nr:Ig-like domain-containing protein [Rhodothermales bacterium]